MLLSSSDPAILKNSKLIFACFKKIKKILYVAKYFSHKRV